MKISAALFVGTACCALAISGCGYSLRQDMANQPYNRPLSPSDFFADGRSERPLIDNTVAHGAPENDVYNVAKDYAGYPLPVNDKLLQRGEGRYKIFCCIMLIPIFARSRFINTDADVALAYGRIF